MASGKARTCAALVALLLSGALHAAAEPAPPGQRVTFPADDGHVITAEFYEPSAAKKRDGTPFAVLCHAYRSDRASWAPIVPALREAGFAVLALDLRGHGETATTETRERALQSDQKLFREMQSDLRGAYDWIAAQPGIDRSRFVMIGASVGASIALQYAAKDRSVDAVVALSPGLNYFGIDSVGDLRQIRGRKLLMISDRNESDAARTLAAAGVGAEAEVVDDATGHGTALLEAKAALVERIVRYVSDAAGTRSSSVVVGTINSDVYHPPDSPWVAKIAPSNLRYYSSPREAESRGLRASRSKAPPGEAPPDKRGRRP